MSALIELADGLAAAGLRHAFGVPGSGATLELIDALERHGVEFHTTYFEGAAALMAGAGGRVMGHAGLALGIKGPGLANMAPGLAACWFDGLPVIAGVEAYPAGSDWGVRHKGLDHESLCKAVAKVRVSLGESPDGLGLADFACSEVPGPVVVELAAGDPRLPQPLEASTDLEVAEFVARAEKPVVIAGSLAARQGWGDELSRLRVPVFTTAVAKGVVDEALPQSAGVYTGAGLDRAPETHLVSEADLVVGLGLRPGEVLAAAPFTVPAVNMDAVPSNPVFGFTGATGTDSAPDVFAALEGKEWGLELLCEVAGELRERMLDGPFLPAHVYEAVERHFEGIVRVVIDTGHFCTMAEHYWRARRADWFLMSGQGRYMGTALPMALGAAMEDRTVPTVAFVGDGGIGAHVGELRLAARHSLPLLIVLLTDGGFGSVRTRAIQDHLTQKPLTTDAPFWGDIVGAMDIPSLRADSVRVLDDGLAGWSWRDGPAYIEVPFDPADYQGMVEGIR